MEGKAKFIFPVLATGIVVFVVICVVTFSNIGLRADFVTRWLSAFFIPLRAPGDHRNRCFD